MIVVVEYLDGTKDESVDEKGLVWEDLKTLMLNNRIHTLSIDSKNGPVLIPVSSIKRIYPK
jgi:acid stress-induced BolA-like protein IbaG/YrbA